MWYVLIVGLINLTVGVGVAVVLQRRLQHGLAQQRFSRERAGDDQAPAAIDVPLREVKLCTKPTSLPAELKGSPSEFAVSKLRLPEAWRELINEDSYGNAVQAAAEMALHLCCRIYEKVLARDQSVRQCRSSFDSALLPQLKEELQQDVAGVLERCQELTSTFESYGYEFDSLSSIAVQLEAEVSETCKTLAQQSESLAQIDAVHGANEAFETIARLHYQFAKFIHSLRDTCQVHLARICLTQGKLSELTSTQRIDGVSGIENPFGLFETFERWRHEDPSGVRLTSFAIFDVNLTHQLNKDAGMDVADRLLARIGRLFGESLRQNRGFDRMFRIGGQSYIAFLGDTSGRNATTASDRLRQVLANAQFRYEGEAVNVTCNTATTALEDGESLDSVVDRLRQAMEESKKHGPNQNALALDGKTAVFEAQSQEVSETIIEL